VKSDPFFETRYHGKDPSFTELPNFITIDLSSFTETLSLSHLREIFNPIKHMSYSSLWHQALKNNKARRVSTGMPPSRKRRGGDNPSNPERRSKRIRKEPPIFMNPTKKTAMYDTMPGGVVLAHSFKQNGTGHQPQPEPRQHQSKIYAGIYKDASTQTLLSVPVSSSAPETDSSLSGFDAEGYQPSPNPKTKYAFHCTTTQTPSNYWMCKIPLSG
jgi:hypothetical protein